MSRITFLFLEISSLSTKNSIINGDDIVYYIIMIKLPFIGNLALRMPRNVDIQNQRKIAILMVVISLIT